MKSFTLIEVIIGMLVLSIMSALAVPKLLDIAREARINNENYTVGGVRTGIGLIYTQNLAGGTSPAYPGHLDSAKAAAASSNNPLFGNVLQQAITSAWEKTKQDEYKGPAGQLYVYNPQDGSFLPVGGGGVRQAAVMFAPSGTQVSSPATQTRAGAASALDALTQVKGAAFQLIAMTTQVGNGGNIFADPGVYGGAGQDGIRSILQTSDGGYVMIGTTASFGAGGYDAYLVKVGPDGAYQWSKTYGAADNEELKAIQQTQDGGYILAGLISRAGSQEKDSYILKVDGNGDLQWDKRYGGTADDWAASIQLTSDGGYAVSGATRSFGSGQEDAYILKLDQNGNSQWSKAYGGVSRDTATSIQQTTDGGYIVGGLTESFGSGSADSYVVKVDQNGGFQWSKTYGGSSADDARSLQKTLDGGYIMAGYTHSFRFTGEGSAYSNLYVVKIDQNGNQEWGNAYGSASGSEIAYSIKGSSDGGYIIAGNTENLGAGGGDSYVVKIDQGGGVQWSKTYGGSKYDSSFAILQTTNGGYAVGGSVKAVNDNGDFALIKTDSQGNITQ